MPKTSLTMTELARFSRRSKKILLSSRSSRKKYLKQAYAHLKYFVDNLSSVLAMEGYVQLFLFWDLLAIASIPRDRVFTSGRYDELVSGGYKSLAFLAQHLSYCVGLYESDGRSPTLPVHHHLIQKALPAMWSEMASLLEKLTIVIDIEAKKRRQNDDYEPLSTFFSDNPHTLADLVEAYDDVGRFSALIATCRETCELREISLVTRVIKNYYSLLDAQALIKSLRRYEGASLTREARYAILGELVRLGECLKSIDKSLSDLTRSHEWQSYKDLRDFFEHPDEESREAVIQDMLDDTGPVNFGSLISKTTVLEGMVDAILAQLYASSNTALMQQYTELRVYSSQHSTLPSDEKASSGSPAKIPRKELKRLYQSLTEDEKKALQRVNASTGIATQALMASLKGLADQGDSAAQQALDLDSHFMQQNLFQKWSVDYTLPVELLTSFFQISFVLRDRDFWVDYFNGKVHELPKNTFLDLLASCSKDEAVAVRSLLKKSQPTPVRKLVLTFVKAADTPNPYTSDLHRVEYLLSHSKAVSGMLHDRLHTEKFQSVVFTGLATGALNGVSANQLYNLQYESHIDPLLEADSALRDALFYHLTVIFGVANKLLASVDEPIDVEVLRWHLSHLKEIRNYLAHQDDYVHNIIRITSPENTKPHLHVRVLAQEVARLHIYFEHLEKKLDGSFPGNFVEYCESQSVLRTSNSDPANLSP